MSVQCIGAAHVLPATPGLEFTNRISELGFLGLGFVREILEAV
jgi:hypothetical protein